MNTVAPNLRTLLQWAAELSAGRPCPSWEAWCAAAPDAAAKWERITLGQELAQELAQELVQECAQELLAGQAANIANPQVMPTANLAAYLNGQLEGAAATSVEEELWRSSEQLALALSIVRLAAQGTADASPLSLRRLQPVQPERINGHAHAPRERYRLAPPASQTASSWRAPPDRPMGASVSPPAPAAGKPHPEPAHWQWPAVAAAALVATCLSVAIGWLTIGRGQEDGMAPIADRLLAEEKATQAPAAARRFAPALSSPEEIPDPPQLLIESALGVVLVSDNETGTWRVVPAQFPLKDPARFLSLAESWATVDIPDVAKLVLEGATEIDVAQRIDGVIEIRLERGHVAIQGLREGVEMRLLAGPASWTVLGLTDDSTLAVMFDPSSPGIAVPRGQIAIDDAPIDTRQLLRWCNGALSPDHHAQPVNAAGDVAIPVVNAWDLDWLAPPDRSRQQQWRSDYGGLADRLAAANDWRAELNRLLATTSDKRHLALLAQWTTTTEPPAQRASRLWNMLGESRLAARIAAVTCLLELPVGDGGREAFLALLQDATDETTRGRVTEWLDATRQAWPLSQEQALQLKSCLTHDELAVRQIAVSLLELHTTTALLQAGQRSPAFDAAGPATSWTAAQQEWESLLGQLFAADTNLTHLPGNGESEPLITRQRPARAW